MVYINDNVAHTLIVTSLMILFTTLSCVFESNVLKYLRV